MRRSAEEIALSLIGQHRGKAQILGIDHVEERAYHYPYKDEICKIYFMRCRCDCGATFIRRASSISDKTMCPECMIKAQQNPPEDLSGQTFHNLTVLSMYGPWRGTYKTLWNVRCNLCGREYVLDGAHVRQTHNCSCQRDKELQRGHDALKALRVDGTLIPALVGREKNRNNASGYTGVSRMRNGCYRAYINFRRKQYHLGVFDCVEDAAAARKEAESRVYGDFLDWYAESHPAEWEKMLKAKGEKKK